jgi:hypothetical protein
MPINILSASGLLPAAFLAVAMTIISADHRSDCVSPEGALPHHFIKTAPVGVFVGLLWLCGEGLHNDLAVMLVCT